MAQFTLTLLGGFRARLTSGSVVALPTRKAQALLAYLALPLGRAHPRDKLAALLWEDVREPQARSGLRQALFALRKVLNAADPPGLRFEGGTVALDPAAIAVDVAVFEQQAATGKPGDLERAAALYQGDLLAGLSVRGAAFEDWVRSERERLRELALSVTARLLAQQRSAGAMDVAVQTALRLLALDPLQEPAHRALMQLYARLGRRGAALRQYQLCIEALQRELGTGPETATKQLYREILQHDTPGSAVSRDAVDSLPSALPRDTLLIGRAAEMGRLREALGQAWSGHGSLVGVVGEAGIGKTRLVAELAGESAARGGRVLIGRSYEIERILAFGPWVDALRTGRVTGERDVLGELGAAWCGELARLLPELGRSTQPAPGGPAEHLRLFEAVARLLQGLARRQPLLLILEDVHWADEMSLRLIGFLGRRLAPSSMLVVVTAREEELADVPALRRMLGDLGRDGHLARIALGPLSRGDTLALVRTLLPGGGDEAAMAHVSERVWTGSEGSPFMVMESLRALRESGVAAAPPADLPLPERVRDVIVGRLERLSKSSRELAAAAAVIGRVFDFALLQRAAGIDESDAAGRVEELVRRRILHGAGEQFDFTHGRIRETVYGELLEPRRKVLHRRAGEALETYHAANLEPHYLAVGLHYRSGEVWDKAVAYLHRAGAAAAGRSANREAVACFEQALQALERLPQTRDVQEQAIDLHFDIRNSLFPLGEDDRIHHHLRKAEALAERLNDAHRLGWASTYISNYYWRLGDHRRGLEAGLRALSIARGLGDSRLEALANFRLGQLYISVGDYREAIPVLRNSVATLSGDLVREQFGLAGLPAVFARAFLACALAELGEFTEAIEVGDDGLEIARALNQPYSHNVAEFAVGLGCIRKGDLGRAVEMLEPRRQPGEGVEIADVIAHRFSVLGYVYALNGRAAEAVATLEQAVPAGVSRFPMISQLATAWLGEAYLRHGRNADAARVGRDALEASRRCGERGNEAYALKLLGDIATAAGPAQADAAQDYYARALAIAEELGMRPLVGYCHLDLGALYRGIGKRSTADEHLAAAATRFRELDMRFWLEKAEEAMAR